MFFNWIKSQLVNIQAGSIMLNAEHTMVNVECRCMMWDGMIPTPADRRPFNHLYCCARVERSSIRGGIIANQGPIKPVRTLGNGYVFVK